MNDCQHKVGQVRISHRYLARRAVLSTKHDKLPLVAPPLTRRVGMTVDTVLVDTDQLGTFTGDIARGRSAWETAVAKARLGMQAARCPIGIASEGSMSECAAVSSNRTARVETDLRAHCCPSRRPIIARATERLAMRLASCCPECNTPGWGIIRFEYGLPCQLCSREVPDPRADVFGCATCPAAKPGP